LRAQRFLEDLADLVENRPPASLEERLEQDEAAAEDYDFARADYRILIALREDYLAHLESVKGIMPSITQNRMRLARMTGAQALSAIVKPGGRLVSEEVAESIVRFVAGGSELPNAEVEPALLSLVCRELNTVRLAQGRAEISADLLAGSRDTILTEFYERALADQPSGVRRVIEDELLTESGYRESLAEERVTRALAAAGAAPDALATLVDRRLLRIEERLDVRRVELTHDVLCGVVRSSRDLRHAREAREEAERQLAAQQAREEETHRTLVRTRIIAAACAGLALVAIAGAAFGWVNLRRARAADAAAQQARGEAERLVGFLIEDFYAELEPTGRLETMGKLAHMAVGYYDGLPPELVTPKTRLYRAMALVREGAAKDARGDLEGADHDFEEAKAVFEQLRADGDRSDEVTYGLALAYFSRGKGAVGGGRGTAQDLQKAAELLRPLVQARGGSPRAKLTYSDVLNYLSHTQPKEQAVETCEESRRILVSIGALTLSNLAASSVYADTSDSQARHEITLGRIERAEQLEREVYDLAEKVLAKRPGDLRAMQNRALASDLLGALALRREDLDAAASYAARHARAGEDFVRFNPTDLNAWAYVTRGNNQVADVLLDQGQVARAIETLRATVAFEKDEHGPERLGPLMIQTWQRLYVLEGRSGRTAAADQALQNWVRVVGENVAEYRPGDPRAEIFAHAEAMGRGRLLLLRGNYDAALSKVAPVVEALQGLSLPKDNLSAGRLRSNVLRAALRTRAQAALGAGRYAEAEAAAGDWLALPPNEFDDANPEIENSRARSELALALVMQERSDEARAQLAPALTYDRARQAAGAKGTGFRLDYAYALYVNALAQPADPAGRSARAAGLKEAAAQLAGMSAEARALTDVRQLGDRIAEARGGA
jgi:tetratricopeptide (TPR) repeat protein